VRVERAADLDAQLADPLDDRLKRRDQRQDDLAAGLRLELASAALRAVAQSCEQLPGGFAARIALLRPATGDSCSRLAPLARADARQERDTERGVGERHGMTRNISRLKGIPDADQREA
jgi:hypothetical protein